MDADQISNLTSLFFALKKRANPNQTLYFTVPEFKTLTECGLVVCCERGGLLSACQHWQGGINALAYEKGVYRFAAEYEGWEYIVNPKSTMLHFNRIEQINQASCDRPSTFEPYTIPDEITVINALPLDFFGVKLKKYLIHPGGGIYIVNKHSTKIHLGELNHLNTIAA